MDFFHRGLAKAAQRRYLGSEEAEQHCHLRLAEYFAAKGDPEGDGTWTGQYPRGLSEVLHHILKSSDNNRLARLSRSAFLERKSAVFGDVEALLDARQIASGFAAAGNDYWDDLVHAGHAHCSLTERIQAEPQTIETLIRRGDTAHVMAAIEVEADEYRRGLLMLAVAELLAESGDALLAAELRRKAATVAGPQLSAEASREVLRYSLGSRRLGQALLARNADFESDQEFRVELGSANAKLKTESRDQPVAPRPFVSLYDSIAAHISDSQRIVSWTIGWLSTYTLVMLTIRFIDRTILIEIGNRMSQGVGYLAVGLLLIALLALWPGLLSPTARFIKNRMPRRVERNLRNFEAAIEQAEGNDRLTILIRAIRYYALARPCGMVAEQAALLRRPIAQALGDQQGSERIVRLIQEATAAGDDVTNAVIAGLRNVAPNELLQVLLEAGSRPEELGSTWQFLRILVGTAEHANVPDLLFRFADDNDAPGFGDEKPTNEERNMALLAGVSSAHLARAILSGLSHERTGFGKRKAKQITSGIASVVRSGTATLRTPTARGEWLLWMALYFPAFVGLTPFFLIVALCSLTMVTAGMLAGRTQNAYALATVLRASELWSNRARIEDTIRRTGCWLVEAGTIEPGIVAHALISRIVLSADRLERAALSRYTPGEIRRSLRRLVRAGLLGRRGDVVLATMGERKLLAAATSISPKRMRERYPRTISLAEHEAQLRRVLPIASRWASLGLVIVLGAMGGALWCSVLWWGRLPVDWQRLLSQMFLATMIATSCFTLYQHVRLPKRMLELESGGWAYYGKGALACFLLILLGADRVGNVPASLILCPLIMTNLVVPELIARWRGAGLLYPAGTRLWAQRILSAAGFVAACVGLAYLTRVISG